MWRRERNRPRALLNGQFYEEERKLEDMLAADLRFVLKKASNKLFYLTRKILKNTQKSENFERKTGGTALSSIGFDSQVGQSEATLVREKNDNVLVGRDWIEENLNYERRHR